MYRIFIIGAGFSKPANLPLGTELFPLIIQESKKVEDLFENVIEPDIERFILYKKLAQGQNISPEEIDLEEFISFLDIEHTLQLKGTDHWSGSGNRTQLGIKNIIAYILNKSQFEISPNKFALYEKFVERLHHSDIIITFNYDTLIENALDAKGIKYRLYQTRYKEVFRDGSGISDHDKEEIMLLKLHGSIDWFDISKYEYEIENSEHHIKHPIFDNSKLFKPKKIIDDPYPSDSRLHKIHRINNLEIYFSLISWVQTAPIIISPSYSKLPYINPLRELWYGLNQGGGYNRGILIIGFSLPPYDEYIRQPLYQMVRNFYYLNDGGAIKKQNIRIVDYQPNDKAIEQYKTNYRFLEWDKQKVESWYDGFSEESLEFIFKDEN